MDNHFDIDGGCYEPRRVTPGISTTGAGGQQTPALVIRETDMALADVIYEYLANLTRDEDRPTR